MSVKTFERLETKYLINEEQYKQILSNIKNEFVIDEHGNYSLYNVYFDTDNFDLIKKSLEKPIYKEKVRLRSYTIPSLESNVFLEIKKKYKGVVYKRRIDIKLKDFYEYFYTKKPTQETQIMKELDYVFKYYKLKPKVYLAYDRLAYYNKNDREFRITFDKKIRSRFNDLNLEKGDYGKELKMSNYVMEVKVIGALPVWFTNTMSKLKIYPNSFSKYGEIYKNKLKEEYNV